MAESNHISTMVHERGNQRALSGVGPFYCERDVGVGVRDKPIGSGAGGETSVEAC
jgi:hypothetical protein